MPDPERCPGCPHSRENARRTRQVEDRQDRQEAAIAQNQLALLAEFRLLAERLDAAFGDTRITPAAAVGE